MPITPEGWPFMNGSDLVYQTPDYTQRLAAVLAATIGQGAPLPVDPPLDTGWVACTARPGFAFQGSYMPEVRRVGDLVYARWGWDNAGISSGSRTTIGDLPSATFYPSRTVYQSAESSSSSTVSQFIISTSGSIQLRVGDTTGSYFLFAGIPWWT